MTHICDGQVQLELIITSHQASGVPVPCIMHLVINVALDSLLRAKDKRAGGRGRGRGGGGRAFLSCPATLNWFGVARV
jgi:hypothetical protein